MSFTITKHFRFEAAHHLPYHDGKCKRPHGHSYQFTLELKGKPDEHRGSAKEWMVVDYYDVGIAGKSICDMLDHQNLNMVLEVNHTTAEYLSKWIFDQLCEKLPKLHAVTVQETDCTSARYCPFEA